MNPARRREIRSNIGAAPSRREILARNTATLTLDRLLYRYSRDQECIEVSFRHMVGPLPAHDLTHSIHPYPARLLRQVPRFFLNCEQLGPPNSTVLDPFCGSGTVLVEAMLRHRPAWGVDANPFARLLSRVKTTQIDERKFYDAGMTALVEAKRTRRIDYPNVINIDHWFTPSSTSVLSRYRAVLDNQADPNVFRALLIVLSLAADRVSLRDRRIPVPVRRRDAENIFRADTTSRSWKAIESSLRHVTERLSSLRTVGSESRVDVCGEDARCLEESMLRAGLDRPALVITSPPYGAAQKYIRSSSLSLGWLGLARVSDLSALERLNIGREHMTKGDLENLPEIRNSRARRALDEVRERCPVRAAIYANYFSEMEKAIESVCDVLKPDGHFVLVAAPNHVAGRALATPSYLADIAKGFGLSLILETRDQIQGRSLLTKRASSSGPPICSEHVMVFRKGGSHEVI